MMFITAQIIAVIALTIGVIGIQFKAKKNIVLIHASANFLWAIQYLLLGAFTGCFINVVSAIRNIWFNYNDTKKKQKSIYTLIFFLSIAVIIGVFTYQNIFSILPIIAMSIYTYAVWQQRTKVIRYGMVLVETSWIIYNIHIMAYVALISGIIGVSSALIAIYRYDIKKQNPPHGISVN